MISVELAKRFWVGAVIIVIYLINRGPSTAITCELPQESRSMDG